MKTEFIEEILAENETEQEKMPWPKVGKLLKGEQEMIFWLKDLTVNGRWNGLADKPYFSELKGSVDILLDWSNFQGTHSSMITMVWLVEESVRGRDGKFLELRAFVGMDNRHSIQINTEPTVILRWRMGSEARTYRALFLF